MLRLGSPASESREMDLDDIFFARLKLMIIMAKAYLNGCPMGEYRRKAMIDNADRVEAESIDIGGLVDGRPLPRNTAGNSIYDHLFYQRAKLLAVMVKAAAKGFPMGAHRKSAMEENIDMLSQTLMFSSWAEDIAFLKVA